MQERLICHLDMDAFFAAVEVLANPSLRGRPLVVGGLPDDRGVVSTASYEARTFGVRSGMPLREAVRLCPQAIFVPCRPGPYLYFSTRILKVLLGHTPKVELFSIDEAFLDGEGLFRDRASALRWAREIQQEIFQRTGLTGSLGIGPNKLVAKMATKLQKPRGITFLTPSDFREIFWGRPLESLYGIGEKTARALLGLGLVTIGDLAHTDSKSLKPYFGILAEAMVRAARGEEDSPVIPYGEGPPPKSIGHEHTFERDVWDRKEVARLLLALADQVAFALRGEGRRARTVHLKIRWSDFAATTRQTSVNPASNRTDRIYRHALNLFERFDAGGDVRLLGLSVSSFTGRDEESLFPEERERARMEEAADQVRERFGFQALHRAGVLHPIPAAGSETLGIETGDP